MAENGEDSLRYPRPSMPALREDDNYELDSDFDPNPEPGSGGTLADNSEDPLQYPRPCMPALGEDDDNHELDSNLNPNPAPCSEGTLWQNLERLVSKVYSMEGLLADMRTTIAAQNDILTTQLSAIDATLVENSAHSTMHTDHFYNICDNQRHWGSLLLKRFAENSGLELEVLNWIIEGLATNSRLQLEAHRHFGNRLVERLAENSGLELEALNWIIEGPCYELKVTVRGASPLW